MTCFRANFTFLSLPLHLQFFNSRYRIYLLGLKFCFLQGWNTYVKSESAEVFTSWSEEEKTKILRKNKLLTHITGILLHFPHLVLIPASFSSSGLFCNIAIVFLSAAVYLTSVVFWDVTQRSLVSHRRFAKTYRSHLQGSRCPRRYLDPRRWDL
jgi:hypothetical protein